MPPEVERPAPSEREQTNRSLRAERGDIDRLILELAECDAVADAAITRARVRADAILASTRASADRLLDEASARPSAILVVQRTRDVEDRVLQDARSDEDAALDDARLEKNERIVTEREATDQGLADERAQSDEVLATRDEVLSVVGHDLRNFVTTILGMAEIIEEDADPAGGAHSILAYARLIRQAGVRMARLIGDLSDVASIEAGTLSITRERGDASAIVIEAAQMFEALAAARGVTLTVDVEAPLPSAAFDAARIFQVIANLLSNALKFTPRGGTVRVRVTAAPAGLCVSVADSGIGIAAHQLTTVFGRNVKLAPNDRRGSGIGLYISKSIIKRHDGPDLGRERARLRLHVLLHAAGGALTRAAGFAARVSRCARRFGVDGDGVVHQRHRRRRRFSVGHLFDPDLAVQGLFQRLRLLVRGPHFQLRVADRLDLDADLAQPLAHLDAANHAVAAAIERLGQAEERRQDRDRPAQFLARGQSRPMCSRFGVARR